MLPAEIDDVPDDQEVAGEVQLLDEIELARDLRARPIVIRAVPLARADLDDLPQERRLRLAGRDRVVGKPVAEIGHRVLQAIGELPRPPDRVRPIAEERRHVGGGFEIPLGVRREPPPRLRQRGVMVDAGEDVEQRPLRQRREPDAVGRDDRHVERRREIDERLVVRLFVAAEVPLQLDVHAVAAEQADETIEQAADAVAAAVERRAAGERDEAAGAAVQILERERAFAFGRAQLHAGDQPAEVSIALLAFAEDGQRTGLEGWKGWTGGTDPSSGVPFLPFLPSCLLRLRDRELCADDRAEAGGRRGLVKPGRAVHAVAIEQRHRPVAEIGRALDDRFRERRALEKAEGGGGVELDV